MCSKAFRRSYGDAEQSLCRPAETNTASGKRQRWKEFNSYHYSVLCRLFLLSSHKTDASFRQLEAITRISEAVAKISLSPVVLPHHVEESMRLFKFSTMDAVSAGSVDGLSRGELNEEITKIEREVRRRLPIGWSTSYQSLVKEFVTQQGYSSHALERTLFIMEKREVIRFSNQKRVVHR